MIFHDFPSRWLGSVAKIKIVLYMLSGAGPAGEREISRSIGLSHVAVSNALREIGETNFLRKRKIGNVNVWSVNELSYAYMLGKHLDLLAKTPPMLDLRQHLESDFNGKAIKKVILFGSIYAGMEKGNSDIDLFLMVENKKDIDSVMKRVASVSEFYKERYGNAISPLVMTEKEFNKNGGIKDNIRKGMIIK